MNEPISMNWWLQPTDDMVTLFTQSKSVGFFFRAKLKSKYTRRNSLANQKLFNAKKSHSLWRLMFLKAFIGKQSIGETVFMNCIPFICCHFRRKYRIQPTESIPSYLYPKTPCLFELLHNNPAYSLSRRFLSSTDNVVWNNTRISIHTTTTPTEWTVVGGGR